LDKVETRLSKVQDFKSIGASVVGFFQNPKSVKLAEQALDPHFKKMFAMKANYNKLKEKYKVNQMTCYRLLEKTPNILDAEAREAFMFVTEYTYNFGAGGELVNNEPQTSAEEDILNFSSKVIGNVIATSRKVKCPNCNGRSKNIFFYNCHVCANSGKVSVFEANRWAGN